MGRDGLCDAGNDLIRELLLSDNIALKNAVAVGEGMKDLGPISDPAALSII
jgi:hypothetical protein